MPINCVLFTQRNDAASIFSLISRINSAGEGRISAVMLEVPDAGFSTRAFRHIKKYGLLSLAYKILELAGRKIYTTVSRLNFATLRLTGSSENILSLEDVCERENILFFRTSRFSSEEAVSFLSSLNTDLGIVYGTGILKKEFFSIPKLGSINIHKRKLPDYRGGGAVGLWELLAGEKKLGITVHKVSERLDGGDIVAEAVLPIDEGDTLFSLKLKADLAGDDLIAKAIGAIVSGTPCQAQTPGAGRLFRDPSPLLFAYYKAFLYIRDFNRRGFNLKEAFKRGIRFVYLYASLTPLRALFARLRGRAPIIIFYGHLVSDRNHNMAIRTELFRKYVAYLKRHYRVISLKEAVRIIKAGHNDEPAVALTFDDGYAENMANFRAGIYQTGVKAAFFIASGYIGSGRSFTHDEGKGVSGFPPFMWDDVSLLQSEGHEIASHTQTHVRCSRSEELPEIQLSKLEIEARLNSPVPFFSFPWGKKKDILPEAFEAVKAAGYEAGFLADSGNAMDFKNDLFAIERTPLPVSGSLVDLEAVIHGWNELAKFKDKVLKTFKYHIFPK